MRTHSLIAAGMIASTVVAVGVMFSEAGPLQPPGGAVEPTYKTLTDIKPWIAVNATNTPGDADSLFKITEPGSYYLTGNVTGVAGKHGIEIAASDVQLDLNGFSVLGTGGADFSGVHASVEGLRNVSVRNGRVSFWGGSGIDLLLVSNVFIQDVHARANNVNGVRVGDNSVVDRCILSRNDDSGVVTGDGGVVTNTIVLGGSGTPAAEQTGVMTGDGARVETCLANGQTYGVFAGNGSQIFNCIASDNGERSAFTGPNIVGVGIYAGPGGVIEGCAAAGNTGVGVAVGQGGLIEQCLARRTKGANINVADAATARGNLSVDALPDPAIGLLGFGVSAAPGATIEGNHAFGNVIGIYSAAAGALVIRNSAWSPFNTFNVQDEANYLLPAGNKVGVIVVPPDSPDIPGASMGEGVGTTDPYANFSYPY